MSEFSTQKIRNTIQSNSQVLKNMTWLSVLQFANYLIPLLILPFITRTLGAEPIGRIIYAQGIISYFTIIINYGFEYSGTREIAINKNNKEKIKLIFWSIIKDKILFLIISFVLFACLSFFFSKISEDINLYLACFFINVGIAIFPTWFFLGMENMKVMSLFNFFIKLVGALLTIAVIRTPSDYLAYALFPSLSYLVIGIYAFFYVIKKHKLAWWLKDKKINREVLISGFPIFSNNVFVSLYNVTNMTILGFYVSDLELGYYSGAYKIILAINTFICGPVVQAVYPAISRKFATSRMEGMNYLKHVIIIFGGISLIISGVVYLSAPYLVKILLGNEFCESIPLLQYFSCTTFLVVVASLLTVQGLYGMGLQHYAARIGAVLATFCISLNFIITPKLGSEGAILSWISTQILEILIVGCVLLFFTKDNNV